jgi:hypothetical protein
MPPISQGLLLMAVIVAVALLIFSRRCIVKLEAQITDLKWKLVDTPEPITLIVPPGCTWYAFGGRAMGSSLPVRSVSVQIRYPTPEEKRNPAKLPFQESGVRAISFEDPSL